MGYLEGLEGLVKGVTKVLRAHDVPADMLKFGGQAEPPTPIRVPTHADSKFMAEQALGDWAEQRLAEAIDSDVAGWRAVRYGFSSDIAAGDEGFKDHYTAGILDACKFGKRADLLIVPDGYVCPADVSAQPTAKLAKLVADSIGALEVRSSRLEAHYYMKVRAEEKAAGKKVSQEVPNFTVKTEDLVQVYRWIEKYEKPQAYVQVFLDAIYAINFLDIFRYILAAKKLALAKPARSRKVTIMVPITVGQQIGELVDYPNLEVVDRRTPTGRHDIFARPLGGRIALDSERTRSLLLV